MFKVIPIAEFYPSGEARSRPHGPEWSYLTKGKGEEADFHNLEKDYPQRSSIVTTIRTIGIKSCNNILNPKNCAILINEIRCSTVKKYSSGMTNTRRTLVMEQWTNGPTKSKTGAPKKEEYVVV